MHGQNHIKFLVDCVWNVMAHAQKPDFVFRRNGRVHLNRRGSQFSRLLAAEVCASAVVMLDTPCSEVVWECWLPTPFASFPFISPPVRHRVPSHFRWSLLTSVRGSVDHRANDTTGNGTWDLPLVAQCPSQLCHRVLRTILLHKTIRAIDSLLIVLWEAWWRTGYKVETCSCFTVRLIIDVVFRLTLNCNE